LHNRNDDTIRRRGCADCGKLPSGQGGAEMKQPDIEIVFETFQESGVIYFNGFDKMNVFKSPDELLILIATHTGRYVEITNPYLQNGS
jgi:hypothetical protein